MNTQHPRRRFLQSMLFAPFIPAGMFSGMNNPAPISDKPGHFFKLSLNVYSFNSLLREGKMDLFDVLDFCAKYNFEAVDPTGYYFPDYPDVASDEFMYRFKRKAFLLGLDISGTGVRNNYAISDVSKRKADVEMIKEWIVAAAKMGIPSVRVFPGKATEGSSREEVFQWMTKDLQTCCAFGAEHGVMIALQNHNEFLQTADDVDRIFEMVNSEWLGQNLDIGSYRQRDPYKEIEQNIGHAINWQIKENVWIDGKETPTDFVKLFRIIKKSGYRGYLPLETLGAGDPFKKIPVLLKAVREALVQVGGE